MSSGSYFTLYRKYSNKMTENELKDVVLKYAKTNQEHDYSEVKKPMEEYAKDIPLVMNPYHGTQESSYDEKTKSWIDERDHSIKGQRNHYLGVLSSDGSYVDELLSWSFGSGFTCLKSEWHMNAYNWKKSQIEIDRGMAQSMLVACNYLLSGKYSDEMEDILDNDWIHVLAEENDGNSLWEYVYRHEKNKLDSMERDELHDEVRTYLKTLKYALEAFLKAEKDYSSIDDTEYVLVYTAY